MRLLCLTNLFPDAAQAWRGLDNVTLLHALRAQDPDMDIRVLCLRPGHGFWTRKSCPFKPRPGDEVLHPTYHWAPYLPKFGGLNDYLFARAVRRALRALPSDWKPDAMLVPWLFPDACGVNRVPELKGIPLLAVAQGSDVHQYLHMPMRRRSILELCQRAHVITRSEDLRQRLLQAGAAADHVSTVYNGVDIETFRPGDKHMARVDLGLPEDRKTLLFVGNFLPVKGLDLLIRSAAVLNQETPLQLVLIGSGAMESEIRSLIQSTGLGDVNVTFTGRKGPPEVAQYMRAADVVCLSSHNEGVPNVLLESFASGRPLVSTQVGGISEITEPSPQGGFLVPERVVTKYVQALRDALSHSPDERTLSAYAQGFSWGHCAAAYRNSLFALAEKSSNCLVKLG